MPDVFISYSRKDKAFVQKLHDALDACNRTTWVDWEGIPYSADWWAEIQAGIEGSDAFIFVISPDSVVSEVCYKEITSAVTLNKRMIPILHREPDSQPVPQEVASLNWIFMRSSDDFEAAVDVLISTIDTDLAWVKAHTRLTQRATEWDRKGRNDSYLLRGDDLVEAEQHLVQTDKEPALTKLHMQYIMASRQNAARRQRIIIGAVTFGLVVAVILGVLAFINFLSAQEQFIRANVAEKTAVAGASTAWAAVEIADTERNRAETAEANAYILRDEAEAARRVATSRELAADALSTINTDPQLSLLLALQGLSVEYTTQAETALRQALQALGLEQSVTSATPVLDISYSPDGQYLAAANKDGTAAIWNFAQRQLANTINSHANEVVDIAYNPAGTQLATASRDGTAKIWDATTGANLEILDGHGGKWVQSLAFMAGENVLATGGTDGAVKLWNLDIGQPRDTFWVQPGAAVNAVAFSPDGALLAAVDSAGTATIWDISSSQAVLTINADPAEATALAFSPDGQQLATTGSKGDVAIWDMATGQQRHMLTGHSGPVLDISFDPLGSHLATVGSDGLAKMWRLSGQTPTVVTLPQQKEAVQGVAFSPDGAWLATVDGSRLIRFSPLNIETVEAMAQAVVTRPLTLAECQKYLHQQRCP